MKSPTLPPPYPLAWPEGWARTRKWTPTSARYRVTMHRAGELLEHEMKNWQAVHWVRDWKGKLQPAFVITSNVQGTYANGRPFASSRAVRRDGDHGVAVWWLERGAYYSDRQAFDYEVRVVACDSWSSVAANLRACGVTIESIRAMERAGATEAIKRAVWGFEAPALPSAGAPAAEPHRPWWAERLGVEEPYTELAIVRAYKRRVAAEHPDRGGEHEAFLELERARDEALREIGRARRRAGGS